MKHPDKLPLAKLSTITTKIGSGATPRGGKESYKDSGITLIRSLNVYDFHFEYDGLAFIDDDQAEELTNVEVREHDILLNITGASVARCCMVPVRLLPARVNQHVALVRVSPAIADPHYVLYCINSPNHKRRLLTLAQGGATREALTKETIENFEIPLPPLPAQRKTAAILSAYDDLIENNTRRIRILEEMAQLLYREWFVYFRFPGHEKVKVVKDIPEGWESKAVGELLEFHINGGWGEDTYSEQFPIQAYVIRGTDIPQARYGEFDNCPSRYHKQSNFESRQLQSGDIVMEISGGSKGQPVGRALLINPRLLNVLDGQVICASFCKLLRVNSEILTPELLYFHLREIYADGRIERYQTQSTGIINFKSAFFLENEQVIIPDGPILTKFTEFVRPILEMIQALGAKNANLRRTRDLLPPRLVSGEVDVGELEIAT